MFLVSPPRFVLPTNMADRELSFFTRSTSPGNAFFIAVDDKLDKVVGTVACYTSKEGPPDIATTQMNLTRVNVDAEFRGQRIASRLIEEARRHARKLGFDKLCIATLNSQTVACKMYRGMGCRLAGTSPNPCHAHAWIGQYVTGMMCCHFEMPVSK